MISLYRSRARRFAVILLTLVALLILLLLVSTSVGPYYIPLRDVVIALTSTSSDYRVIVLGIRLPRSIAAVFLGVTLAICGHLLQTLFNNPLVEPYTLGIASAAALGTVIAISSNLWFLGSQAPQVLAFILAFATSLLLLILYRVLNLSITQLLLLGISLSLLYSAISTAIQLYFVRDVHAVFFMIMGRVSHCRWSHIVTLSIAAALCLVTGTVLAKPLNALLLGEEHCLATGYDVRVLTLAILFLTSLSTSLAVSICGVVSFIGLVTPHISRALVTSEHRYSVPISAVLGACLTLLSDMVARSAVPPFELPLSVVTAMFGVPFFMYIMLKLRYG